MFVFFANVFHRFVFQVVICSLYKRDVVVETQFGRPVLSVALEPRYAKSKQGMFVSGGMFVL
jgi:hypothetical protein